MISINNKNKPNFCVHNPIQAARILKIYKKTDIKIFNDSGLLRCDTALPGKEHMLSNAASYSRSSESLIEAL